MTLAQQSDVNPIGGITELQGFARVVRNDPFDAKLELPIQQNDNVETANGRVAITFLDDSVVRLTEHSKLEITEYIFDPDPSKSTLALNFASGTARFVTGGLGIHKENISIRTPTANIAIRGTDFTTTVDELGRSLIILLPDANGNSSGEITVSTAMGIVVLNEPYQATTTTMFESTPSEPVILDLTLEFIDNLLIVNAPREVEAIESTTQTTALDVDFLEFDGLDIDALATNELEFEELDIDYLAADFFVDLLAIVDESDILKDSQLEQGAITNIEGTETGQDLKTQIVTTQTGDSLTFQRHIQHNTQLNISGSASTSINLNQDGATNIIKVNGGNDSTISISQGS
jgi:hypothetical protein